MKIRLIVIVLLVIMLMNACGPQPETPTKALVVEQVPMDNGWECYVFRAFEHAADFQVICDMRE